MTDDWPLVGRRYEMARAVAAQRTGRGLVITGVAGVGKTRLTREVLREAEARGAVTARVSATRAAAAIPLGALAPFLAPLMAESEDREQFVQDASSAIAALSRGGLVAVAVDDAHLLDAGSAAVVRRLLDEPSVTIVATVRAGEPLPDEVSAFLRDERVETIELTALMPDDVDALLENVLGATIDTATRRELFRTSAGNPLYLRELVRGAIESGSLRDEGVLWRLSGPLAATPRLVELVEARLEETTREERIGIELLAIAEVIGVAEFDAIVGPTAGASLEERGVVEQVEDGRRRQLRFAHPIYGEVVRASIPVARRRGLTRSLADALESTGARRREDGLRVAAWRLEGGGTSRSGSLLSGARQAMWAFDLDLAKQLAGVAWSADRDPEAALVLARVFSEQGLGEDAVRVLESAAAAAADDGTRAQVAMSHADILFRSLQRDAEAEAVNQSAAAALTEQSWIDELTAQRARMHLFAGRPLLALDELAPLLAQGQGRAFAEAVVVAGPALAIVGRTNDAVAIADEGMTATFALGDAPGVAHPAMHLLSRVLGLMESGRLEEAVAGATAGYEGSIGLRSILGQGWFALNLARVELLRGHIDEAARFFGEGAGAFRTLRQEGRLRMCLAGLALTYALVGAREPALAALADLDRVGSIPDRMLEPDLTRARAWVALVTGHRADAERLLREAADAAAEAGQLILEAAALHDVARIGSAAAVADRLAVVARECQGELVPARAAHVAALAAEDPYALEAAALTFVSMQAELFAAEAYAEAARHFRRHRLSTRATECAKRRDSLRAACGTPLTPALRNRDEPSPLTGREREIASLAAEGMASREIAVQLSLSVRTVDNHLRRVYEKLGVSTRAALASEVLPGGS